MALGTLFGKLFGGGGKEARGAEPEPGEAVEHGGFTIVPAPFKEGGQYRTAGTISREVDGVVRSARFIRADNHADRQAALDHSVRKGMQLVDEQGAALLDRENV